MNTSANQPSTEDRASMDASFEALSKIFKSFREEALFNENEMRSVCSLIAFVSCLHDTNIEWVCSTLAKAFNAENIKDISRDHYDDVIRFLVDLRTDKNMN